MTTWRMNCQLRMGEPQAGTEKLGIGLRKVVKTRSECEGHADSLQSLA